MKSAYLLPILSGILIGTSYIPFPPWAIFFCFVPLWLNWLRATKWTEVFISGWITQFVLALIGFNWVMYTVHEFGHLPWPAAFAVLMAFAGICTLSIPVAGVLWWWYARAFRLSPGARVTALVALTAVSERLVPMIFDWHFGYTWLWAGFPAFHLADAVGFAGLSTIGLAFNGLFLHAWQERRRGQQRWWTWAAAPLLAFAALNLAGHIRALNLERPDKTLGFLIAQANIANEEKLIAETGSGFRNVVLEKFLRLTEQGLTENPGRVDFTVWPETAFPDFIDEPELVMGFPFVLRQRLTGLQSRLITGAYSRLPLTRQATNSFFALDKNGRWLANPYHKTVLLAFGEFFPGAEYFPKLREWFPEVADFGRGPGPSVLDTGLVRLGAQICYEGLFDWFTRGLANRGAQVIVNLTNDSWYGSWQQPYQHLYMTLARAIEVRRPLVRSTNTGISAAIAASGEILGQSPVYREWQHLFAVEFVSEPKPTVFMGWGYWLMPALLGLTLVGLPLAAVRSRRGRGG